MHAMHNEGGFVRKTERRPPQTIATPFTTAPPPPRSRTKTAGRVCHGNACRARRNFPSLSIAPTGAPFEPKAQPPNKPLKRSSHFPSTDKYNTQLNQHDWTKQDRLDLVAALGTDDSEQEASADESEGLTAAPICDLNKLHQNCLSPSLSLGR